MIHSARRLILWSGLGFAFAPVILNIMQNLVEVPRQRYTLLPLLLFGLLLIEPETHPSRNPNRLLGSILLAVSFGAEIVGISTSSWLIARAALPFAMIGMSLVIGQPGISRLALMVAMVPIPEFVIHATSPQVESWLALGAARFYSILGIGLDVGGPLLEHRDLPLELMAEDSGIVTASLLAELGWYSAVKSNVGFAASLRRSLATAAWVILVQPVLVLVGVAALLCQVPGAGRFVLTHGVALFVGAAVISQSWLGRGGCAAGVMDEPPLG